MRSLRIIFWAGVAGLTVILFSFKEDLFLISKNLDIFTSLYKEVSINYVDETDASALMRAGIDSMLDGLDPYTEYIPESEIEAYKLKYVSTQYGGIGASTLVLDKKLYVNELLENGPAHKQDLLPGDQILKINDIEVYGKGKEQISQLMRGPKGSSVKLQIARDGKVIDKVILRDEIKQHNVSYSGMLANQIGYIRLDKFLENAGQEVKDALLQLNRQPLRGLVLDLRNNGGGILQEAVKIVNLFVDENMLIVVQKGRNPSKTVSYKSTVKPVSSSLPLIVLINGSSASASEIVAGALQDLDRAVIVGEQSYGKGLVQQTFNLPYNSLVKITVAKYFTPSGRCIQALDYAHKDERGAATKFSDSTLTAFTTKGGRTVFSGNGISPDVAVPATVVSLLTQTLASNHLFFDFVNTYKRNHKQIEDAGKFSIHNADYELFLKSLKGKDYSYTSDSEQMLDRFEAKADAEKRLIPVKAELDQLRAKVLNAKENELNTHKDEIKQVLESQVVARYYFEKGKIEHAFQYDQGLKQALALLAAPQQMKAVLSGDGVYKTISAKR